MEAQEIIIFEPSTSEEAEALKAFGKALKLKFKVGNEENFNNKNGLDSIEIECDEKNQVKDIPAWHKTVLYERLKDYHDNPGQVKNFDDLLKKKKEKYGL